MDTLPSAPSRHRFTAAARAAAMEARRRRQENSLPKDTPEVFAVRLPLAGMTFGWEIRRFGSVVLARGAETFETAAEARVAGEAALPAS